MKLKKYKKIIAGTFLVSLVGTGLYFGLNNKSISAEEGQDDTQTEINTEEIQAKIAETIKDENQNLVVESKETTKSQEELANQQFDIFDSLTNISVNYEALKEETQIKGTEDSKEESSDDKKETANNNEEKTADNIEIQNLSATENIIVSNAYVVTTTGTTDFDKNDKPGYDSSPDNDIVRTYDQIIYSVNFAVQNVSTIKYSNIRYRITTTLDDAVVTTDVNNPKVRAEIVNGSYIQYKDNNNYYAQGVASSVLQTSGQVTVPVTVNVLANKNREQITPTFKIEILDALNNDTGGKDTFEEIYTQDELPKLKAPITYVSAMPSATVQLVQGSNGTGLLTDETKRGYDVGVVTMLAPIPNRSLSDYRGSTFPEGPITYTIKTKGTYQDKDDKAKAMNTSQYNPFTLVDFSGAQKDRKTADWANGGTQLNTDAMSYLQSPAGYGKGIYLDSATEDDTPPSSERGVYNSGEFDVYQSDYITSVTNSSFTQVINPYMYDMTGKRTSELTNSGVAYNKSFSSLENVYTWDFSKTEALGKSEGWKRYDMYLYIDSISYDGYTNSVNTQTKYATLLTENEGWYRTAPAIGIGGYPGRYQLPGGDFTFYNAVEESTGHLGLNYGNAMLTYGSNAVLTDYAYYDEPSVSDDFRTSQFIVMWDSTAFKFNADAQREMESTDYSLINPKATFYYGVAYDETQTAPYTMKVGSYEESDKYYKWYKTAEEAEANGSISAIKDVTTFDGRDVTVKKIQHGLHVPVEVTATGGDKTPAGNPIVLLGAHQFIDKNANVAAETIVDQDTAENGYPINGFGTFIPTKFNSDGSVISNNMTYPNFIGECAFVKDFSITTFTYLDDVAFETTDLFNVYLESHIRGSLDASYDSTLKTTLPKGIVYVKGSSYDSAGNPLDDPEITLNSSGQYELLYKVPTSTDIKQDYEMHFTVKTKPADLTFKANGTTNSLLVSTVGEAWLTDDTSKRDTRDEKYRSSGAKFIETLNQQVTVRKTHNKQSIEVGNQNQFNATDNSITYYLNAVNSTMNKITSIRVVDVLPYNGDSRGTVLNGDLKITNIQIDEDSKGVKIYYNNKAQKDTLDPANIALKNYTQFNPATDPITDIENAKSILLVKPNMATYEEMGVSITVQPTNPSPGDKIVNAANMNSSLDLVVKSAEVKTNVYGRSVNGVAWYDLNKDGLMQDTETKYKNMPVKLYRKSDKDTEADEQVKYDLKGNKFIDDSGKSIVYTDDNGYYSFDNLPDGKYYVQFDIQDQINSNKLSITEQNVGGDAQKEINSKASIDTAITPNYNLPTLSTLAKSKTLTNNEYIVPNINIGVIEHDDVPEPEIKGKVTLFKYEEGTAKDEDGDGKLSDKEKSKGTPLENVSFDLYNSETNEKISSHITDKNGFLTIDNLDLGNYYFIETKTLDGYELNKSKINFSITESSTEIKLYISNAKQTNLPFTGSTTVNIIIISGISILILSITGIMIYTIKQNKLKNERTRKKIRQLKNK